MDPMGIWSKKNFHVFSANVQTIIPKDLLNLKWSIPGFHKGCKEKTPCLFLKKKHCDSNGFSGFIDADAGKNVRNVEHVQDSNNKKHRLKIQIVQTKWGSKSDPQTPMVKSKRFGKKGIWYLLYSL